VCKKDFNWSDWLYRHSLRRYCRVSWTIELRANSIRSFGLVSWFLIVNCECGRI
jgi:hypothetical protein